MSLGSIREHGSPSTRGSRGQMLVEWIVGMGIGLTLLLSVVSIFSLELQTLRDAVWRQRRERDAQDLMAHLRRELRRAGLSNGAARTAEHEAVTLEGSGSTLQVHYRSDPTDSARATGRSTFRMTGKAMQWRTPSTGGFQQLTDPQVQGLKGWAVVIRAVEGCGVVMDIAVQMEATTTGAAASARRAVARRRNEGGVSCAMGTG